MEKTMNRNKIVGGMTLTHRHNGVEVFCTECLYFNSGKEGADMSRSCGGRLGLLNDCWFNDCFVPAGSIEILKNPFSKPIVEEAK